MHGYTLTADALPGAFGVQILDGYYDGTYDQFSASTYTGAFSPANGGSTISCFTGICAPYFQELVLEDSTGQVFSGTSLPATLSLASFTSSQFYFAWADYYVYYAAGKLNSLEAVTSVPEPSIWALMLTSLSLLPWLRRRPGRRGAPA